jgi:outer membrane protein assembly factor BamD
MQNGPLRLLTKGNKGLFLPFIPYMKRAAVPVLICLSLFWSACSNKYQKTLKNPDPLKKLELAQNFYNKKDYYRASTLFEQLQDNFNGTEMGEKVIYYSAYCNYGLQNYILAGYQFKSYYESFPTGKWSEESLYMYAYCLYLESQQWYLDQTDTYKALEALKLFISVYPDSRYVAECNGHMDKLRAKLSYKAYRNATLYYHTQEYKAAVVALQNVIKDYPEIQQREELDYLTVKSYFLLAENSFDDKKQERYDNGVVAYQQFLSDYPDSRYIAELKKLNSRVQFVIMKMHHEKKSEPDKQKK